MIARALRAVQRAARSSCGVRIPARLAGTMYIAVSASVLQAEWTASERRPRRVRSQ